MSTRVRVQSRQKASVLALMYGDEERRFSLVLKTSASLMNYVRVAAGDQRGQYTSNKAIP